MDDQLGTWIFVTAALPYVAEIIFQIPLQRKFYEGLPAEILGRFPHAPKHSRHLYLSHPSFMWALWKFIYSKTGDEIANLAIQKRRMRHSLYREFVFAGIYAITALVLVLKGWNPLRLW